MSDDELRDWNDANDAAGPARTARPCDDCPIAWARQQAAKGCCNGHPAGTPRDWNERAIRARKRTRTEHRTARADTRNGRS